MSFDYLPPFVRELIYLLYQSSFFMDSYFRFRGLNHEGAGLEVQSLAFRDVRQEQSGVYILAYDQSFRPFSSAARLLVKGNSYKNWGNDRSCKSCTCFLWSSCVFFYLMLFNFPKSTQLFLGQQWGRHVSPATVGCICAPLAVRGAGLVWIGRGSAFEERCWSEGWNF